MHIGRKRGAIDFEKTEAGTHRQLVNQARRQLLAGTVLSRDKHGRAGLGQQFCLRSHLAHAGAGSNEEQVVADLFNFVCRHFALTALAVKKERTANSGRELLRPKRPHKIILGPQADCFQFLTGIVGGSQNNYG